MDLLHTVVKYTMCCLPYEYLPTGRLSGVVGGWKKGRVAADRITRLLWWTARVTGLAYCGGWQGWPLVVDGKGDGIGLLWWMARVTGLAYCGGCRG